VPWSGHAGFVVDKVELGQVFSEYFGFPCQSLFHQLLHDHLELVQEAKQWPQSHPSKNNKKTEKFHNIFV
jgi:hypothetical protein